MSSLEKDYLYRSATQDDLDELLGLFNQYWEVMTGVVKFTRDDFESIFSAPGFDIGTSIQVVTSPQGEIIASVLVMDVGNPPVHPNVYGCVRAGYEGQGLGHYLLQWAETRAMQAVERCPEGSRVSMYLQTTPSHQPTIDLFEKSGLAPIRYSWFMMKDLDETQPTPVWPEGIHIQTYADDPDLETILKAADEAFEDHWGHVDRSGDEERIKRFRHSVENDPDFDPTLWILAMAGDEIAGVALCNPRLGADRSTGVVDTLGVRRPWRRQGLGLALLHHAFNSFHKRGFKKAGLGVDTQNLSGATRLYTKAGMHVTHEFAIYEKELRAGEELSKQAGDHPV